MFLLGCMKQEAPYVDPYEVSKEEVAYMVGCIDAFTRLKELKSASICADMTEEFLMRHRREWREK